MSNQSSWPKVTNADEIDSPALLIYPERVLANIRTAISMVGDVDRLRPHVKTHKCAEVAAMMITAGIHKFKCATIAEAEMLGMAKAKDVLLAYQPGGPKLTRFINLVKKYPGTAWACLTDNLLSAREMANAFSNDGLNISLYIDLNVGMNRTGINPGNEALDLYEFCFNAKGITIKGLHAYDGHIRHPVFAEKKKQADEAFLPVEKLQNEIIAKNWPSPVIIAGGSPTFSVHCLRKDVECSPGTFIYWDHGYSLICPEQDFLIAAVLLTRVISRPGTDKICTDLGHKSVAAENEITKRIYFPAVESLTAVSQSEEHLVLENKSGQNFKPGHLLYGIPYHICPTVALYDSVHIIENDRLTTIWKNIARDRSISV